MLVDPDLPEPYCLNYRSLFVFSCGFLIARNLSSKYTTFFAEAEYKCVLYYNRILSNDNFHNVFLDLNNQFKYKIAYLYFVYSCNST